MSEDLTPWQLFRQGRNEEALEKIHAAYLEKQTIPEIIAFGVAYLWLEDYNAAWEHFDGLNREKPKHRAVYYNMAGVAKWCLGQHDEAVAQWRIGCKCGYSDGAGGVGPALLLFVATVIDPASCSRAEPEAILDKRSKSGWYKNWPGPVADYVLGRIDEERLRIESARFKNNERAMFSVRWEIGFYLGIVALSHGKFGRYEDLIREAAVTSDDDFDPTKKQYGTKIWKPEFHLARHLAAGFGPEIRSSFGGGADE